MSSDWPDITYEQALAAYEAGQKLHRQGRVFLVRKALRASEGLAHGPLRPPEGGPVRQVPRSPEEDLVLWVTDQRTLGDHGLLLFPDGRTEAR
jgi:hypothetical protein